MKIYREIIGNVHKSAEWKRRVERLSCETVTLDRWSAQKSRMRVRSDAGREYRIALSRGEHLSDGDVIDYSPDEGRAVVVSVQLSEVLVIEMDELLRSDHSTLMRASVELGHALGNQHWPAVVKDDKVYVPLAIDKRVMLSVMATHKIDGISYAFRDSAEIIPYLSPLEVRVLLNNNHPAHAY